MTREEFSLLVKGMKAVYAEPNFIADQDAFNMWFMLLGDLDYKVASDSVKTYMMTNSKLPKPADIRSQVVNRTSPEAKTHIDAWNEVMKALRNSTYHSEEEFEKLSPLTKKAVGSPSQLRLWATTENFNEQVEQSHFRNVYESISKRAFTDSSLPTNLQQLSNQTASLLEG